MLFTLNSPSLKDFSIFGRYYTKNLNRRHDWLVSSISISFVSIYCENLLWLLFMFWWIWCFARVINPQLQQQSQLLVCVFTWLTRDSVEVLKHIQINQTEVFHSPPICYNHKCLCSTWKSQYKPFKWNKHYLSLIWALPFVILFILYFLLGISPNMQLNEASLNNWRGAKQHE